MRTLNPRLAQTFCWQQLGFVRNCQSLLYFFSVDWFEAHEFSRCQRNTTLYFFESMALMFFCPPFFLSSKFQIVSERELCPRVENYPRTPNFISVLLFCFFLHRLRRWNLSPCCKLPAEKSRFTFLISVGRFVGQCSYSLNSNFAF